jgi:hypothetical protein
MAALVWGSDTQGERPTEEAAQEMKRASSQQVVRGLTGTG